MKFVHILSWSETGEILQKLKEQFGISKIPGKIIMRGEDRMFILTGNLTEEELQKIENSTFIERVGIYFAKFEPQGIRLSIEGTQILSDQISNNVFEIPDEKTLNQWMSGQELPIKTGHHEFLVMKYKDDFLGCGKASENKIGNFIPKNRRLKLKE